LPAAATSIKTTGKCNLKAGLRVFLGKTTGNYFGNSVRFVALTVAINIINVIIISVE
jgi:hypothetical protein